MATPPAALDQLSSLIEIVHTLRSPGGCPWDQEQTFDSLKPYLLEEAHELYETLTTPLNIPHFKEELGDVLLQVIMLTELASEQQLFTFPDVIQTLCEKLIRRHPHVYGDIKVSSIEEIKQNWAKIKQSEKDSPPQ